MTSLLRGVFVVGAKRTAFGSFGGRLKDTGAIELCETASRAAITQAAIDPKLIDSVTVGSIIQIADKGGAFISRTVGLRVGVRQDVPCLTVCYNVQFLSIHLIQFVFRFHAIGKQALRQRFSSRRHCVTGHCFA